jgi:hypothetical protein
MIKGLERRFPLDYEPGLALVLKKGKGDRRCRRQEICWNVMSMGESH